MRRLAHLGLFFFLTGCGTSKAPPVVSNTTQQPPVQTTKPVALETQAKPLLPPKPAARYQGRTAEQWSAQLFDHDWDRSWQAACALRELGDDGVPYLVSGLVHGNSEVSRLSSDMLRGESLRPYAKEALPVLLRHLREAAYRTGGRFECRYSCSGNSLAWRPWLGPGRRCCS